MWLSFVVFVFCFFGPPIRYIPGIGDISVRLDQGKCIENMLRLSLFGSVQIGPKGSKPAYYYYCISQPRYVGKQGALGSRNRIVPALLGWAEAESFSTGMNPKESFWAEMLVIYLAGLIYNGSGLSCRRLHKLYRKSRRDFRGWSFFQWADIIRFILSLWICQLRGVDDQ